jgi:hypothetical protein
MNGIRASSDPVPAASADPSQATNEVLRRLLNFLEIDDKSKHLADRLLALFVTHAEEIVVNFYHKVQTAAISPYVTDDAVKRLKPKQEAHWTALLSSDFGGVYAQSTRRVGIQHRDIALNAMWYVAGYAKLKLEFLKVIAATELSSEEKISLLVTLEKYTAADMALALSTYEGTILD